VPPQAPLAAEEGGGKRGKKRRRGGKNRKKGAAANGAPGELRPPSGPQPSSVLPPDVESMEEGRSFERAELDGREPSAVPGEGSVGNGEAPEGGPGPRKKRRSRRRRGKRPGGGEGGTVEAIGSEGPGEQAQPFDPEPRAESAVEAPPRAPEPVYTPPPPEDDDAFNR
jgi:hypothetical protein